MYTARDLDLDGLVGFGSVFVKSQVALLRLLGQTRTQWVQTAVESKIEIHFFHCVRVCPSNFKTTTCDYTKTILKPTKPSRSRSFAVYMSVIIK